MLEKIIVHKLLYIIVITVYSADSCDISYGSVSAEAWNGFQSSLITGEGLINAPGADVSSMRKEIDVIQNENVAKLSAMTEDEIQQERQKIEKNLSKKSSIHVHVGLNILHDGLALLQWNPLYQTSQNVSCIKRLFIVIWT